MAKASKPQPFEVACPCCKALLKVDPELRDVIAHTPPAPTRTFADMEEAVQARREQESRRESLFRQSVEAQKQHQSLLDKKFEEAVKRAKETPDEPRPLRDFDLD